MDNKLKNMEEEYTVDNLEKLLIEKSCKIGFLENEIREKSFEISKLKKILGELVNEKFQIKPSDKIVIKLNEIYKKLLKREIDLEGILYYYPQIKNGKIEYGELENNVKKSPEYTIVQKMPKTKTAFNELESGKKM